MNVFVEREDGVIVGVYANLQPGYAEEEMDEQDAEVLAFRAPPSPDLTMRQFRLGLLSAGLLSAVTAAVENLGEAARIEFEYASTVKRDNILVTSMIGMLGLTGEQVDAMWVNAANL